MQWVSIPVFASMRRLIGQFLQKDNSKTSCKPASLHAYLQIAMNKINTIKASPCMHTDLAESNMIMEFNLVFIQFLYFETVAQSHF